MLKNYKLPQVNVVVFILLQAVVYVAIFAILFIFFTKPILSLISLLPIILISWKWGSLAGCAATLLNSILVNISIHLIDPNVYKFVALEPIMGLFVQLVFAITTGTFSSMAKSLRLENTERRNAEKQLNEYKDHLEDIVQERTTQLQATNERLHQIEKMEVVGQLAGGIAHDFNNQLSIVLGYSELLKNHLTNNPKLLHYVQQIQISGDRASDLTKQLLAFARKDVYKMHIVNIHTIIQEIIALLSHTINKNITIKHVLGAKTPFIWGGANQIQNALLNLALNARDAMPNGGTLTFATENIEVDALFIKEHALTLFPGSYVSIMITDTGTGMDSEVLKHLFEPFFTTKAEGKGTGMGLAATYGIVKSHKGGINVNSIPDAGSTFSLYFQETSPPLESDVQKPVKIHEFRKLRILIIDDEKMVAQTIRDIINAPGIDVSLAFSGSEAVKVYKQNWKEIDIVLLDMMMPDIDGQKTFLLLKEINPAIKVIISSGYALNLAIDQTLKAGASAFIQKPYNRHELFHHIDSILS
jgi:signal transduction histidine kinase/CheY-like chemotaxis protein